MVGQFRGRLRLEVHRPQNAWLGSPCKSPSKTFIPLNATLENICKKLDELREAVAKVSGETGQRRGAPQVLPGINEVESSLEEGGIRP
jgi:hypothetical protein